MSYQMTYPRCFTTGLRKDAGGNRLCKGDPEIIALYQIYLNRTVDTSGWSFRKRVLANALRLFGEFKLWTETQSVNPVINGYNLEFLSDTLNFIQTGQRRMGIMQWFELLNEVSEISTVDQHTRLSPITIPALQSTERTLQKWCSHPNGFDDLMLSLNVFFGAERAPDFIEPPEHRRVGIID